MAKKRGNNEGSIHHLPSGTWRAQVTLEGRRLSFTGKTRKECQEWLKKTIGQIDNGMTFTSTKITVGEFLTGWLTSSKASIRPRTWTHYEQICRNYILPRLGGIKIRELRSEQIQALYDDLIEQDVGAYTVLKVHTVLHSAMGYAVKIGNLIRNPVSLTMPPKEPAAEMKVLDEKQVNHLLVSGQGTRLEAILHLALATGMREMELLGLKWSDLDWVKQILKVERQLVRPEEGKLQFAPPKTKSGKRSISLGSKSIDVLRQHYERQHLDRKAAGERWQENGLIFPNSLGGPIHPRNLLRDFKKLLLESGLPKIRFHDLRHTAASLMLNNGIPPIVVSKRLGHAKTSITLDIYGHLIPTLHTDVGEVIDDMITPIPIARQNEEVSNQENLVSAL